MTTHNYTAVCTKSWASFRPGSVADRGGSFTAIADANDALEKMYDDLVEEEVEDGWTFGVLEDGRRWYNCDDWGHEESYKLRIARERFPEPGYKDGLMLDLFQDEHDREEARARFIDDGNEFTGKLMQDLFKDEQVREEARERFIDDGDEWTDKLLQDLFKDEHDRAAARERFIEDGDEWTDKLLHDLFKDKDVQERSRRHFLEAGDERTTTLQKELFHDEDDRERYRKYLLKGELRGELMDLLFDNENKKEECRERFLQTRECRETLLQELLWTHNWFERTTHLVLGHGPSREKLVEMLLKDGRLDLAAEARGHSGHRADIGHIREEVKQGLLEKHRDELLGEARAELKETLKSEHLELLRQEALQEARAEIAAEVPLTGEERESIRAAISKPRAGSARQARPAGVQRRSLRLPTRARG
ncbi:Uu.00g106460.m01.CDS01 [Anthostomella pinea]|uniref:Uu.00g106460.m01.CDS01 n=1 Tax=Anthostomella pinea TaxID=933095 RepID=A0AAI8YFW2_9PEZI|nr:Uu.00g106460.m01.CDS01 [Anthostomella pinea]